MRFRLRVLALMTLVLAAATGATAWLTVAITTQRMAAQNVADERNVDFIVDRLTQYGRAHGTWEGVATSVETLSRDTGARIRLTTEYGEVIVDTDTIAGRTARPQFGTPYAVNPRPVLQLSPAEMPDAVKVTLGEITRYRFEVTQAACLTRRQVKVNVIGESHGIPRLAPEANAPMPIVAECAQEAAPLAADQTSVESCARVRDKLDCLRMVLLERTVDVAPLPLQMHVGAPRDPPDLVTGPVLAAVVTVVVLGIAASFLLSRRVLRPVTLMTVATRLLAEGRLDRRVPLIGNDELTAMARSFNSMADSLQQAEERQRRLVADVAHELRTPLANLRGYLEALKDGVVKGDPALFASLHDEALLQQRIVDDLQELALAEAGALVYQRMWVEVGDLLETCRVAHEAGAEAAGVNLVVDCRESIHVFADPDRLRQAVGNLVSNACKYTPAGGRVVLRGRLIEEEIVVEVGDTGIGIAKDDLPHIFDRFWRTDTARGRSSGGTGLGLAIARQLVLDHGGNISATSQPGIGTTITIRLPHNQPRA